MACECHSDKMTLVTYTMKESRTTTIKESINLINILVHLKALNHMYHTKI
ncbi:MAG: hypothetical protein KDH96_09695 [Candidatus Riesia sp.]|nr:hypothetical protein [Candidatus Riesia sp.]